MNVNKEIRMHNTAITFSYAETCQKTTVVIRKCNIDMIKPRFANVEKTAILKLRRKKK